MNHYDVIVIGSGAGGGTLVHHLAPSGKRVLLLERGDWLPRESQNWSAAEVFMDNRYVSPDTWYDPDGKPQANRQANDDDANRRPKRQVKTSDKQISGELIEEMPEIALLQISHDQRGHPFDL